MNIAREQHSVSIDGVNYIITALDATYGLGVLTKIQEAGINNTPIPAIVMKELIIKCVTVNSMQLDNKSFDNHFSKKYKHIFQLFEEITKFNFGDLSDPNEQGDTSDQ